jgi:NAD-dependent deacetylase
MNASLRSIVILTGAGISKESGLATFRDTDGIWAEVRLEDVATPEAFQRDPERVHGFYNARRRSLLDPAVAPNAAHLALARLEQAWPGDVLVVTQNIDDLHERAGSRNLLHMHGELLSARCLACGQRSRWPEDMDVESRCPPCGTQGSLRVDVVWFGEMPFEMERIFTALEACDLFLSIGTSGSVYPAAGFIAEVRRGGRTHAVELNLEPSDGHSLFHEKRYGPASETVPAFVEELLRKR